MQILIAPCSDLFLCSYNNGIPIVLLSYVFCVVTSLSFLKLSSSFCFSLLLFRCSYLLLLLDFFFFTFFFFFFFFFFLLFIGLDLSLSLSTGLSLLLSIGSSLSSLLPLSLALSLKLLLKRLLQFSLSVPSTGLVGLVPRLFFFLERFLTQSRISLGWQMKLGFRRRLLLLEFVQPIFLMNLNVNDCSVAFCYIPRSACHIIALTDCPKKHFQQYICFNGLPEKAFPAIGTFW